MSPLNSADQAMDLLLAVALGLASGLLYCFFSALRQGGRSGNSAVFLQDMLFWLAEALAAFCFLLLRCRGELRGYVYFGMIAGFILFRIAAHRPCLKIMLWLMNFSAKLFSPLGALFAALTSFFDVVLGKFGQTIKKGAKKFQKAGKKA